jgi:glucosylceramidase
MSAALTVIRSARGSGERLAPKGTLPIVPLAEAGAHDLTVFVDPARAFQEVLGFGAAFTEAAAYALAQVPQSQQDEVLKSFFDADSGHGYRFCRIHMGSCDFALGNWAQVEKPGDFNLESFSLHHDRKWLLPLVKRALALAKSPVRLFASPWSPPAWMKTNGMMNRGGHLKPECRDAWANCYVKFIQAYAAEGVPIWGVSVQNEPAATQSWDSCVYSPEEEAAFVRDHLAPALDQAGLGHIAIICWDHNREDMVLRAHAAYADPKVRARLWGMGFHWYCADVFDNARLVHDCWPDKHLLFTEGCQEGGPHPGSWDVAERYAKSMLNDLNRWTVGWVDWNLCLDDKGGPNHVGNLCSAPVLVDPKLGPQWQPSYAAIGHLSRYVKPGAKRLLAAAPRDYLDVAAFINPDGTIATVLLNRGEQNHKLRFQFGAGKAAVVEASAHSLHTLLAPAGALAAGSAAD